MNTNDELKEKVKAILTKLGLTKTVKLAAHALADGATVYTEAEAPAVGDAVYTDEAMTAPVADGSYTLESGVTLVVAGGVIAEMVEAPTEDAEMAEMVETLSKAIETATAENATLKTEVETLKAQLAKQNETIEAKTKLAAELATKLQKIKPGSVTEKTVTEKEKESAITLRTNNKALVDEYNRALTELDKYKLN